MGTYSYAESEIVYVFIILICFLTVSSVLALKLVFTTQQTCIDTNLHPHKCSQKLTFFITTTHLAPYNIHIGIRMLKMILVAKKRSNFITNAQILRIWKSKIDVSYSLQTCSTLVLLFENGDCTFFSQVLFMITHCGINLDGTQNVFISPSYSVSTRIFHSLQ